MHISAYSGKSLRRMSTWWRPISRASPSAGPTRPRRSGEGSFRIRARPRQVDRQGDDIGFSYERFCHASDLSVNHAAIQVDARLRERANWGDQWSQPLCAPMLGCGGFTRTELNAVQTLNQTAFTFIGATRGNRIPLRQGGTMGCR